MEKCSFFLIIVDNSKEIFTNMGMSFYYNNDDVSLQAGLGVGSNYTGWNVSGRVGDFSMGFGQTTYDAGTFHGTEISSQRIGTISASYKWATFSISNDLWGDKKDRWRSSAAELTIGRFSFGTYVDTNWGRGKRVYVDLSG